MFGRGLAVFLAFGGAAMAVAVLFPAIRIEVADPATFAVALVVLFVIVASTMPARPSDYAGIPFRAAVWLLVAGAAVAAYTHRDQTQEIARTLLRHPTPTIAMASSPGEVELQRTYDGHFRAHAKIGAAEIRVMLDTGASIVLLRHDDAERIGLNMRRLVFSTPVTTANGRTNVAPVMLSTVRIGDVVLENVRAAVAQEGSLHTSLLGMSFLGELEEVSIRRDRLILRN